MIYHIAETTSTNDLAREERYGHGDVICAERQTAGRGRMQRRWESPAGTGLYLSAVVRPEMPLEKFPSLTFAAAMAACDACRALGAPARIKWPNDLVLDGRKVAGILLEREGDVLSARLMLTEKVLLSSPTCWRTISYFS